jgi:transcriptional antiterminator NusG
MPKEWCALRTHVGYEHRIKTALQRQVHECSREAMFGEIVIPMEKVIDLVRGKKQTVERRLLPGYIFIEMAFSQDIGPAVHVIPKVVGFVGEVETAPTSIPLEKFQEVLKRAETGIATPRPRQLFVVGACMKIVGGPWQDFTGMVESVKPERSRLRVAVSVFGRPTPVELDFLQVQAV